MKGVQSESGEIMSGKRVGKSSGEEDRLPWHTGLVQVMQQEFFEYLSQIDILSELQLTTEPLKIDIIIIKKEKGLKLDKNIARIFRTYNIIEYKSPDDSLSLDDFAKVHSYAYLYKSITRGVDMPDISISFIVMRRPYMLLKHLREVYKYAVQENSAGIYEITGCPFPTQIIEAKLLPEDENIWLKTFRSGLRAESLRTILNALRESGRKQYSPAYLNLLMRANTEAFEEVQNMAKRYPTLEEALTQIGLVPKCREEECRLEGIAQGREEGIEHERDKIARNLLAEGMSVEKIASIAELPVDKVRALAYRR